MSEPNTCPRALNALEVLQRMDYQPGDRVLVENFLRILGDRGMWVIENPLAIDPRFAAAHYQDGRDLREAPVGEGRGW